MISNIWDFIRFLLGRPEVLAASAVIFLWQAFLLIVFCKGSWEDSEWPQ